MKIALYPGSFDPWHIGHENVLDQALQVFDKVIIGRGINPVKSILIDDSCINPVLNKKNVPNIESNGNWEFIEYEGLTVDFIKDNNVDVVIKGIRNTTDFEYEKMQQYWNEDLGISVPTLYIISDRSIVHYSSSAIKLIEKIKK